jgi:hypothetical protein
MSARGCIPAQPLWRIPGLVDATVIFFEFSSWIRMQLPWVMSASGWI